MATPDLVMKRGDRSPSLIVELVDDAGAGVVLPSGSTARFNMRHRTGTKVVTGAAVVTLGSVGPPVVAATLRYDWAAGSTDVVGQYDAEFEVTYSSGGTPETFPRDRDLLVAVRRDVA